MWNPDLEETASATLNLQFQQTHCEVTEAQAIWECGLTILLCSDGHSKVPELSFQSTLLLPIHHALQLWFHIHEAPTFNAGNVQVDLEGPKGGPLSESERWMATLPHHQWENWRPNFQPFPHSLVFTGWGWGRLSMESSCLPGAPLLTYYLQTSIAILAIFKCLKLWSSDIHNSKRTQVLYLTVPSFSTSQKGRKLI